MTTESVCAKCGGTGWIIVERANVSGAEPCDCRAQGRAERLEDRAQIPPLFRQASFDNFVVPGPDNPIARRELTNVLLACIMYFTYAQLWIPLVAAGFYDDFVVGRERKWDKTKRYEMNTP